MSEKSLKNIVAIFARNLLEQLFTKIINHFKNNDNVVIIRELVEDPDGIRITIKYIDPASLGKDYERIVKRLNLLDSILPLEKDCYLVNGIVLELGLKEIWPLLNPYCSCEELSLDLIPFKISLCKIYDQFNDSLVTANCPSYGFESAKQLNISEFINYIETLFVCFTKNKESLKSAKEYIDARDTEIRDHDETLSKQKKERKTCEASLTLLHKQLQDQLKSKKGNEAKIQELKKKIESFETRLRSIRG